MKILFLVLLFGIALAVVGVLLWGLTRDSVRSRIERQRNRDALAGAYLALSQIQTFSEDDYAKNLAKVALDDLTKSLGQKPKSLTD